MCNHFVDGQGIEPHFDVMYNKTTPLPPKKDKVREPSVRRSLWRTYLSLASKFSHVFGYD